MNDLVKARLALWQMQHARCIANIHRYAACANRQISQGEWLDSWEEMMTYESAKACEYEEKMAELLTTLEQNPE